MVQEQWLQLKMMLLLGYNLKFLFSGGWIDFWWEGNKNLVEGFFQVEWTNLDNNQIVLYQKYNPQEQESQLQLQLVLTCQENTQQVLTSQISQQQPSLTVQVKSQYSANNFNWYPSTTKRTTAQHTSSTAQLSWLQQTWIKRVNAWHPYDMINIIGSYWLYIHCWYVQTFLTQIQFRTLIPSPRRRDEEYWLCLFMFVNCFYITF